MDAKIEELRRAVNDIHRDWYTVDVDAIAALLRDHDALREGCLLWRAYRDTETAQAEAALDAWIEREFAKEKP